MEVLSILFSSYVLTVYSKISCFELILLPGTPFATANTNVILLITLCYTRALEQ